LKRIASNNPDFNSQYSLLLLFASAFGSDFRKLKMQRGR